tara:strand:+ start:2073 stop:2540 length:468 start_codon:yes stop_codon:yes gene_type:complete
MEVILPEENPPKPKQPDKKSEKKKGVVGKIKEGLENKEQELTILSTFVRLGVVVWSGFIISLNYVPIPGVGKTEPKDITFIASVFTGAIASFGLESAKKRGDGTYDSDEEKPMTKKDIETLMSKNNENAGYQIIRVETPIKIVDATLIEPKKNDG